MTEFLYFRKMLTRTFIHYVFWLWLVVAALVGLAVAIAIMTQGGILVLVGPIAGVVIAVVYAIVARIICELMIIGFEIHAELVAVRNVIAPPTGSQGFPVTPVTPVTPSSM